MSFNTNDKHSDMIHLGNYEEYFILYMDNELDEKARGMVEAFLIEHPDLQGELELLMGTRLENENLSLDKSGLYSDSIKTTTVDEDLLLLIDEELSEEERKAVEQKIRNNEDLRFQHNMLLSAKLDKNEMLPYPDKRELYRYEKRKMVVMSWIRVAAAAVIILAAGLFYFAGNESSESANNGLASQGSQPKEKNQGRSDGLVKPDNHQPNNADELNTPDRFKASDYKQENLAQQEKKNPGKTDPLIEVKDLIIKDEQQIAEVVQEAYEPRALKTSIIESNTYAEAIAVNAVATPSEIINTSPVTSALANRNTITGTLTEENQDRDGKGSIKGFLRKATRLIEKKTGIDPTNDGELLIGAVAINLK